MTDEQIIAELDLADASEDLKQRTVSNTRHIVEMRVIGTVTEIMSEDQADEFQALVEAGDNDAVWAWLRDSVVGVDVSQVYEAALKDYIEEFKARQFQG